MACGTQISGTTAQRHNGDGGGESQSKRQELTFEFCSALAEVMQLSTDALAQVGTSAESTCHTPHATRHTPHATRHTPHATRHTPHVTRHTSHVTLHQLESLDDSKIEMEDIITSADETIGAPLLPLLLVRS